MSRQRPCAVLAEARSAFVDGALSAAARERLLIHLITCRPCRFDVEDLRSVRELLRRSGRDRSMTSTDLSRRLLSIAEAEPPPGPGRHRPLARVPQGARRTVSAVLGAAVLAAVVGVVGYAAAPPPALRAVLDPTDDARAEFASALAQIPLATGPSGAAWLASVDDLTSQPPGAPAVEPAVARGQPLTAATAHAVLERAARAADAVSYSGRRDLLSQSGGRHLHATIQVDARSGQGTRMSVLDANGRPLSSAFFPAAVPARAGYDALTALLGRTYSLSGARGSRVAGRSATMVQAVRDGRLAARWWVDDASGIVLWQQSYDPAGALEVSTGFTSVTISRTAGIIEHLPPKLVVAPTTTTLALTNTVPLAASGWFCPEDLAGLSLVKLRSDAGTDPQAVHLVYSDGLATVSVFEQRGRLTTRPRDSTWDARLAAYVHRGAATVATWQSGSTVFTVLSDGPDALVSGSVAALPHAGPPKQTSLERVEAGWGQILAGVKG